MRGDYLERLCALLPEVQPGTVRKVVELLQKDLPGWEITRIIGGPEFAGIVGATKQASMFLVMHRMEHMVVAAPTPPPAKIIDALSPDEQLEMLATLYAKREELLKKKMEGLPQ